MTAIDNGAGVLSALQLPLAIVAHDGSVVFANELWRARGAGVTRKGADAIRSVVTGVAQSATFDCETAEGTWLRITVSRFNDGSGAAALLTASDLTNEKRLADTLAVREAELAGIEEAIDLGLVLIALDEQGDYHFTRANARLLTLTGMTAAQFRGRIVDTAPPDSAARTIARCREAAQTRQPVTWRAKPRYPAGEIDVEVTVVPHFDADGVCRRFTATVRDMTAIATRDEALQALEHQAERQYRGFNASVRAIRDFVYMFDRAGRFTYGNQPLLDLLNVTVDELTSRTLEELGYDAALAERIRADIRMVIATAEPVRGETPFQDRNGNSGCYEYIFHPVLGDDGKVELIAGTSRDVTARKAAEASLRSYADEQRALVEKLDLERRRLADAQAVAKIGSWLLDHETNRIKWSEETYRIFDMPLEDREISYSEWFERVHPEDRDGVEVAFRQSVAEHTAHLFDHRLLLDDGTVRWVQERCETQYAEDGRPLRSIGTVQDVTERKFAEAELQYSQQLLRIASRVGQIGGWEVDLAAKRVAWSDEVCAIHGVPPGFVPTVEEAIAFYAPEYREAIGNAVQECVRSGQPFDGEFQIINVRGERVWIRAMGEAEIDHNGTVVGVRGAFQNITERKHALEALRVSEERFRTVAQATSDVVWDWDVANDTCWWSDGLHTQLGYPDSGLLPSQFWTDNIHPDDRERVLASVQKSLAAEELWNEEYRFRKADGTYVQVVDRSRIARDEHGKPYRMLGALVDVTARRTLEARLERVERVSSLGHLAANMAHEFNNVLMSIQPFAELIRRAVPNNERVDRSVTLIKSSVERGRKVTEEILRFTRGIEPVKAPIRVREWLEGFRSEAEALLNGQMTLELKADDGICILGDRAQLNQVLANLLINSRDASPENGVVSVSASRCSDDRFGCMPPSSFIHVVVRDSGRGIAPELLSRIFDPLFTTKRNGTGLGLAICHQVVTAHGGHIVAENVPGSGAAFHILLPGTEAPAGDAADQPVRAAHVPGRVLIVEDELAVADGLTITLTAEGAEVTAVHTGGEALDAIRSFDPDVVLLDIGLPDMNGVDVCHAILAEWPSRKVVFMTGHLSRTEVEALLAKPHVGFLAKPFTTADLLAAFASV
ncbi:MAG TPA: PAS domain-containing protein [Thermoanaerobaculia bacterium]|nr:PAS domain-containing protein [Thermoanaerobaculia bacterium]